MCAHRVFHRAGLEKNISFAVSRSGRLPGPHHVTALDHIALQYHVDFPLNVVITADHLQLYGQIFRFMLKLKRAEYTLRSMFIRTGRSGRRCACVQDFETELH